VASIAGAASKIIVAPATAQSRRPVGPMAYSRTDKKAVGNVLRRCDFLKGRQKRHAQSKYGGVNRRKAVLTGYSAIAGCVILQFWGGVRYCATSIAGGDTTQMVKFWRTSANSWPAPVILA